jgi:polyisoprenoid-binding protein YceI
VNSHASRIALLILCQAVGIACAAAPALYEADAAHSHFDFYGTQEGAEFKGSFRRFTALIEFAPEALASAHFDVQVELNSLDSADADRDKTMRSADFFDVAHFPMAHYVTRTVTKTAKGYHADGALTLHGVTKDVPIDFQFAAAGAGAKLEGTGTLKRLDFGVGQGEWKSTGSVGDSVRVSFSLALAPKH